MKDKKWDRLVSFLYMLIGVIFFGGYYLIMEKFVEVNTLEAPYLFMTLYLLIGIVLFPYVGNRVNIWIDEKLPMHLYAVSRLIMIVAYLAAPLLFIYFFSKEAYKKVS